MDIGNLIGSVVGGVASGGVGSIFGGVLALGKGWLNNRHEAKMASIAQAERQLDRVHDLALADKEIQATLKQGEMHLKETMFEVDSKGLISASKSQDKEISALESVLSGSYKWVISFAGVLFTIVTASQKMTRIVLTVILMVMTNNIYSTATPEIKTMITHSILSFTGFAVTFWFMTRPKK